jgi:signal transduction histidine kinase
MQIRARLTVMYLLVTGSILVLSFGLIYYFSVRREQEDFNNLLFRKARTSADLLLKVNEVDSSLLRVIDRNKSDLLVSENISVYDERGMELYTSNDTIHFHKIIPEFGFTSKEFLKRDKFTISADRTDIVGMTYRLKGKRFLIMAGAIDTQGERYLERLWQTLLLILLSVLCITGYIGWWYAGRALQPINNIMSDLDRVKATDLSNRLMISGNNDEIDHLINAFNDLLQRIEKAFDDQRSFASFASHELNNPLASLSMQIEVALLKERGNDEYEKVLSQLHVEIIRLREVTSQLLMLSGISFQSDSSANRMIRIDDLIFELVQRYSVKYPECHIMVETEFPDELEYLELSQNPVILDSALSNLIENACKYAENGEVWIEMHLKERIAITLTNRVNDLSESEPENWFKAHYRRKGELPSGSGIGLTIVHRICDAKGFTLSWKKQEDRISFTIEIPR